MPTYTVVGFRDENGELYVAGVFAGEQFAVDSNGSDEIGGESVQRWASSFEATDPDHAEELAHEECAEEDSDESDD